MFKTRGIFWIVLFWSPVSSTTTWTNCHGDGWVRDGSDKCYFIEETAANFLDAYRTCWKNEKKLVTLESEEDFTFLRELLTEKGEGGEILNYWLSVIDGYSEGTWGWLKDNTLVDIPPDDSIFYPSLREGNNDELDCGSLQQQYLKAADCVEKYYFICEKALPTWNKVPSNLNTTYGSNVTLDCSFMGDYDFAPRWISAKDKARMITSGNEVLGDAERYKLIGNIEGGNYDLQIIGLQEEDAGTWICSLPDAEEPEKLAIITVPDGDECEVGYEINNAGICGDINECEADSPCHENAECTNTDGSFTCVCNAQYMGDGIDCTDINECLDPTFKKCSLFNHEKCKNLDGDYECVCQDNYVMTEALGICEIDLNHLDPESRCKDAEAPSTVRRCQEEDGLDGEKWAIMPANCSISLLCPDGLSGLQKRTCDINGIWKIVDRTGCINAGILAAREKLTNVSDVETLVELLNIVGNISRENSGTGDLLAATDFVSLLLAVNKDGLNEEKLQQFAEESFAVISDISGVHNAEQVETLVEQVGVEGSVDKMSEMIRNAGETIMRDALNVGISSLKIETETVEIGIYTIEPEEEYFGTFIYPQSSNSKKKRSTSGTNETEIESWVEIPASVINALLAQVPEGETLGISVTLLYSANEIFPADFVSEAPEYTVDWVDSITSVQSEPEVNTPLVYISILPEIVLEEWPEPITIHLKHVQNAANDADDSPQCAFVDYAGTDGLWNTNNCKRTTTNYESGFTVCECKIIADIAAIMKLDNPVVHFLKAGLSITVTIASGFSFILLSITLIFYILSGLKLDRHFIMKNLLMAYMLMMAAFLIGNNLTNQSGIVSYLCKIVSMFQHIIMVCCFSWSMIQCFQIKFRIVNMVFNSEKYRKIYFVIGWLVPLIILGIVEVSMHSMFNFNNRCFVVKDFVIQSAVFMPVVLCVLIGAGLLFFAHNLYKAEKQKMERVRHDLITVWHELRSCMIIFPINTLVWLFGYLYAANDDSNILYGYSFALLEIVLSSALFLCYSQLNEEILLAVGRHCCSSVELRTAVAETEKLEEERLTKIKHIKNELELYEEKLEEQRKQKNNRSSMIETIFMAARETHKTRRF